MVAVLLGGASRVGFIGDVVAQLLAIPLLVIASCDWIVRMAGETHWRSANFFLHIALLGVVGLLILQLSPWPQTLSPEWESRIMTAPVAGSGISLESGWRGFTATPAASWAAGISLIPFFAVLFGVGQLDQTSRFRLTLVVIVLGAVAMLVGFIQVLQGPNSGLRFFDITNPSEAVGFFANRNHFAAQLYTTLIFAAVCFTYSTNKFVKARTPSSHAIIWFAVSAILIVAVLAGIAMARSRAGLFLSIAALAGIVAMHFSGPHKSGPLRNPKGYLSRRWIVAILIFAILFALQFGLYRILTRFENDPLKDLRFSLSSTTFELALQNMPFGTGFGSFVEVYANAEKPQDLLGNYANRAHNDWAEFLLETGALGAVAGLMFLAWFVSRFLQIWQRCTAPSIDHHQMLQRGATLVILLLLAHSLADYPLRTTAMAAIFAFAAALLIPAPRRVETDEPQSGSDFNIISVR